MCSIPYKFWSFHNKLNNNELIVIRAIRVLTQMGVGGGVSTFPEKSVTKVLGSMLLALRWGGWGSNFQLNPRKKRYEGVRFNVISSVTRGWVGVQFPGKKRSWLLTPMFLTRLEWERSVWHLSQLCLVDLLSVHVSHLLISMSLELYPPVTNC